ncbi:ABC transporter permease [Porphyromonas miyakawae]|uniref:ABC transporter permease n=1 Tax=Porphyromonas miyakawae TaxID=3137470 RepID=A0ABQ0E1I0_9PORP
MLKKIFDTDTRKEVLNTLKSNRKRTITTAMGIFWGMFLLIILLCVGSGIQNGFVRQLNALSQNSFICFPNQRTIACDGFPKGSVWHLTSSDTRYLHNNVPEAVSVCEIVQEGGNWGSYKLTYEGKSVSANNKVGVTPEFFSIHKLIFVEGRPLNTLDEVNVRASCIIGEELKNQLFGGESAVGKIIENKGTYYTVVGVVRQVSDNMNLFGNAAQLMYIPASKMRQINGYGDYIGGYLMEIQPSRGESVADTRDRIGKLLKARHSVAPEDRNALFMISFDVIYTAVNYMLKGILLLVWIIGIGTLMGGIISVSNIMLVTINERKREIGVKRAIGAKPGDIRLQIALESLTITFLSGLGGMVLALLIMIGVNAAVSDSGNTDFFYRPLIPFELAILCVLIVGLSGILAGLLPASRALKIRAVEALQEE